MVRDVSAVSARLLFRLDPERCTRVIYIAELTTEWMLADPFSQDSPASDELIRPIRRLFQSFEENEIAISVRGEITEIGLKDLTRATTGLVEHHTKRAVSRFRERLKQLREFILGEEILTGDRAAVVPANGTGN